MKVYLSHPIVLLKFDWWVHFSSELDFSVLWFMSGISEFIGILELIGTLEFMDNPLK